jgi:hypothetical protein
MIPTTSKIIQLSPYGLEQAITILLTLNLSIYHIAQVLHCFVDASFENKLAFTTDLPNTKQYFSRIAVFE